MSEAQAGKTTLPKGSATNTYFTTTATLSLYLGQYSNKLTFSAGNCCSYANIVLQTSARHVRGAQRSVIVGENYSSQSIGSHDTTRTRSRRQKLVPGSVSWRMAAPCLRSIQ
jgi:hypothetical protein